VTVSGSTLSANSADDSGGGIYTPAGTLSLVSAIVAGNTASQGPDISSSVSPASSHNLIGDGSGLDGISNHDSNGNQVGGGLPPAVRRKDRHFPV
jgi:predicted outer membrane repeat protein